MRRRPCQVLHFRSLDRRSVHQNSSAAVYGTQLEHREHDDSQRRGQQDRGSVQQPSLIQDPRVRAQPKAHGIIIDCDVTNKESSNSVKDWTGEVDKHVSDDVNKLLTEDKCDLAAQEELSTDEAKDLADTLNVGRAVRVKRAIRERRD